MPVYVARSSIAMILCVIGRLLSTFGVNFNNLCPTDVEESWKMQTHSCHFLTWFTLATGWCGNNLTSVISGHMMLQIKFMSPSCEIALRWTAQQTFDDKSTLVQVMAWCRQATTHYLTQYYWHRSRSPCGITRPLFLINPLAPGRFKWNFR